MVVCIIIKGAASTLVLTSQRRDPLVRLAAVARVHEAGGKRGDSVTEKVRVLHRFKIKSLKGSQVAVREGRGTLLRRRDESVGAGLDNRCLSCRHTHIGMYMREKRVDPSVYAHR